jgi:hypothetical protein
MLTQQPLLLHERKNPIHVAGTMRPVGHAKPLTRSSSKNLNPMQFRNGCRKAFRNVVPTTTVRYETKASGTTLHHPSACSLTKAILAPPQSAREATGRTRAATCVPAKPSGNGRQAQQNLQDNQKALAAGVRRKPAYRNNLAGPPAMVAEESPQIGSIANQHVSPEATHNDRDGTDRPHSTRAHVTPKQRRASKRSFLEP